MRRSVFHVLSRLGGRAPFFLYAGGIALGTAILSAGLLAALDSVNTPDWLLLVTAVLTMVCASHFAVAFVNWLATLFVRPRPLPRMDFSEGIPAGFSTLVVVNHQMLTNGPSGADPAGGVRSPLLANRGDHLYFGPAD